MEQNNNNGKGLAIASLVLGIVGLVFSLIISGPVGFVLGIIGVVLSSAAKKAGFVGGMNTAGFVLSLIALILGAIMLVACIACAGTVGMLL